MVTKINKPFTKWVKVNKIVNVGSHASTSHHISAVADGSTKSEIEICNRIGIIHSEMLC